ncbi:MAG: hypothetical protein ACWGQW_02595 [bacterium]
MSNTCQTCYFWGDVCHRAGSPKQGQPTQPTDTCGLHQPKSGQHTPLPLTLVPVEMPQDQAMMITSISICPGDSLPCPTCFGLQWIVDKCTACKGTGRVGLAKRQPGVVRLINIGKA